MRILSAMHSVIQQHDRKKAHSQKFLGISNSLPVLLTKLKKKKKRWDPGGDDVTVHQPGKTESSGKISDGKWRKVAFYTTSLKHKRTKKHVSWKSNQTSNCCHPS